MRNLFVFGGSSHPELTESVCRRLGIPVGKTKLTKFSNNETSVEIKESVRDHDVYIIQSGCGHVNDNLVELLIMINACKIASAKRIIAVIPYFPYSRQADVPHKASGAPLPRLPPPTEPVTPKITTEPVGNVPDYVSAQLVRRLENQTEKSPYREWLARSGTLVADLLTTAGADHIITMDLHDAQFQGFFDCPVDNLASRPCIIKYIQLQIPNYQDAVIVSPDAGGAKRATSIADRLQMDFALIHKERRKISTQRHEFMLVGDVRGRDCILVDDICDTSYTITKAAKLLRENGAKKVYAIVSHALLSANAMENIENSMIDEMVVSNSIPLNHTLRSSKIKVFDVAPIFSEAIRRIHFGESLSMLFDASHELV